MAVLFCAGEDIDFGAALGGLTHSSSSSTFRLGYARCSLDAGGVSIARSNPFPGGGVTSCWLTFRVYTPAVNTTSRLCGLGSSATPDSSGLFVGISSASATRIALFKRSGGTTTQLAAETGNSVPSGLHRIDLEVSYGASNTCRIYVDGALVLTHTGDVTATGVATLDSLYIIGAASNASLMSEIIVADTDSRTLELVTLAPNGAGDTNTFTSGAYTDIDELDVSHADAVNSGTAAQDFLCNVSAMPSGTYSILAVRVAARGAKGSSGPGQLEVGVKTVATINLASAAALTGGYATYERLMATNPVTSSDWTKSEGNALQIALRSQT